MPRPTEYERRLAQLDRAIEAYEQGDGATLNDMKEEIPDMLKQLRRLLTNGRKRQC